MSIRISFLRLSTASGVYIRYACFTSALIGKKIWWKITFSIFLFNLGDFRRFLVVDLCQVIYLCLILAFAHES